MVSLRTSAGASSSAGAGREVINVWDYEKGECTLPFTYSALQDALDTWCEQEFGEGNPDGDYNLRAYITNASY